MSKIEGIRISFSSLRADRLTPGLLAALKQSKVKTATIAPEAGTDRLRRVINKGLSENDILTAATTLVENGIPNLKLYFMIGLPTETMLDVDAIIQLVKKIKHRFFNVQPRPEKNRTHHRQSQFLCPQAFYALSVVCDG